MNYIAEIKSFERWLETHYLPIQSQLLWYKLMALFNGCGWVEWITVDNMRLMSMMQMAREATFIDVRNRLLDAGLIEYRRGKKGSPNQYKMISFHVNTTVCTTDMKVETVAESEVDSGAFRVNTTDLKVESEVQQVANDINTTDLKVQTAVNTVDINKQNKNKPKKKDTKVSNEKEKHSHGEYKHVCLTDEEIYKLTINHGEEMTRDAIKFLDEYMEEKPKYKSASHYLAIGRWVIKAVNEQKEKEKNVKPKINPNNRFNNFNQRDTDYDAMILQGLSQQIGGK